MAYTFRTGFSRAGHRNPAGLSGLNSLTSKAIKKENIKSKDVRNVVGGCGPAEKVRVWKDGTRFPTSRGMFILSRFCLHPKHREASASGVTKIQSWRCTKQAPRPAWPRGRRVPTSRLPSAPGGPRCRTAGGRWGRIVLQRRHRPGTARLYDFHDNRGRRTRPARPASRCAPRPNSARGASRSPAARSRRDTPGPATYLARPGPRRPRPASRPSSVQPGRAPDPQQQRRLWVTKSWAAVWLQVSVPLSRPAAPTPAANPQPALQLLARRRRRCRRRCSGGHAGPAPSPRMRAPPAPCRPALTRRVLLRGVSCRFLQNSLSAVTKSPARSS